MDGQRDSLRVRVRFDGGSGAAPAPAARPAPRDPRRAGPPAGDRGPAGLVACVAGDGRDWEVALCDAERTRLVPLTRGGRATPATRPLPSPDGRRLAYFAADGTVRVRSLGDDGRDERVVAEPGGPVAMAWSPDGRQLALDGIQVVHLEDGSRRRVAEGRWPQWLPDGRRLLFARDFHVWVRDLADGREARLTGDPPLPRTSLRLSPGGRHLAYATPPAPAARLRVLDLVTRQEREVDSLGVEELEPAWAPAPELLAFVALEPDAGSGEAPAARVRVADASGAVLRDVARLAMPLGTALSWSPDGRFLAAVDAAGDGHRLCLLPVDGRGRRWVAGGAREVRHPWWFARPAGMRHP